MKTIRNTIHSFSSTGSENADPLIAQIEKTVTSFNENYNNTVVDTYAFDKALHSMQLIEYIDKTIYTCYINSSCKTDSSFEEMIQWTTEYTIEYVKAIYKKFDRHVVNRQVYQAYVEDMILQLRMLINPIKN